MVVEFWQSFKFLRLHRAPNGLTVRPGMMGIDVMTVDRRYFEGLMADRKLSLRGLARRMSLGHSQLSLTFSGTRRMKLEEASALASIFSVPMSDVIRAAGIELPPTGEMRVPVVGGMRSDGTIEPTPEGAAERATAPCQMPEDTAAVQIRTAGGAFGWADGWLLFFRKTGHVEPGCLGRLCVAQVAGGPMIVATLARGYRDSSFNASGFYQGESLRLEWAAPVVLTRN